MSRIDGTVLDFLEKVSHKQQRITGKTHFFWMKVIAVALIAFILWVTSMGPQDTRSFVLGAFLVCLLFGAVVYGFDLWERMTYERMSKGLRNSLRLWGPGIILRCLSCYAHVALLISGAVIELFLGHLYQFVFFFGTAVTTGAFMLLYVLLACDPLPPTKSKIREWLERMFRKPVLA